MAIAREYLALVKTDEGEVLCRLRDLSLEGANAGLAPEDAGPILSELRVVLFEAGPFRTDLELRACVAGLGPGWVRLAWIDLADQPRWPVLRLFVRPAPPEELAPTGS
jgi:hypothetical protein